MSRSILRSWVARAALAGAAAFALASPAAAAPTIDYTWSAPTPNAEADPFYTPPATIPAGEPGDVIRARPAKAGPPAARRLADAWQVMYLSTDALGARNVVTGTILVPKNKDLSTVPVVAMAPGTTGPAFRCTVSRFINSGAFYEQAMLNGLLRAGYAVAVTDYEGYHENPDTTYIVGKTMGAAVLDAARAAARLPEAGLPDDPAKVMVQGYSQGGAAAMNAGEMQPTYAPELNLIAVSGGGVPTDLPKVALLLEGGQGFGFFMNALIGLDNAYPDLNLENYFVPGAKQVFDDMNADDCTIELLMDYRNNRAAQYVNPSPFVDAAWLPVLRSNTIGKTKIQVPVFDYHATNDPIVAYGQALKLRNDYCALGVDVTWKTFDTGHITTVARGNADVLTFLADRVAGKPTTPNCGT